MFIYAQMPASGSQVVLQQPCKGSYVVMIDVIVNAQLGYPYTDLPSSTKRLCACSSKTLVKTLSTLPQALCSTGNVRCFSQRSPLCYRSLGLKASECAHVPFHQAQPLCTEHRFYTCLRACAPSDPQRQCACGCSALYVIAARGKSACLLFGMRNGSASLPDMVSLVS